MVEISDNKEKSVNEKEEEGKDDEELPGCCSCKPRTEILVVGTGLMGRGILGILI